MSNVTFMSNVNASKNPVEQIPAWYYGSDELYELEIDKIFKNSWLNVLREDRIAKPGDYAVVDILDASILVTRGRDGVVRAFHNFCTHRGTKLCHEAFGHKRHAMACVYHGWVFDTEGHLVDLPREETLWPGVDKASLSLKSIHCATWGGFVFVHLADQPAHTLEQWLGPVHARTGELLSRPTWHRFMSYECIIDCNWKFGMEAQMEGNHAEFLHMQSAPNLLPLEGIFPKPYDTPGVQGELTVYFNAAAAGQAFTPVEALAYKVGRGSLWEGADVVEGVRPDYGNVLNLEKRPDWFFDQFTFWPNWVNFLLGGVFSIQRWWPIGPDKTFWTLEMWMDREPQNFAEVFFAERNKITQRDIIVEDLAGPMFQQGAITSGALKTLQMCEHEILIKKMYNRVLEQTGYQGPHKAGLKRLG